MFGLVRVWPCLSGKGKSCFADGKGGEKLNKNGTDLNISCMELWFC